MSELRKNPLSNRWVLIAPQRGRRPSSFAGKEERDSSDQCPFCPGNEDLTPPEIYRFPEESEEWQLRVIPNKYPAIEPAITNPSTGIGLRETKAVTGQHEVIIDHRKHSCKIYAFNSRDFENLLQVYQSRLRANLSSPGIASVVLFRNYGHRAGASLDHPHSQLISLSFVPQWLRRELDTLADYHHQSGECLLCQSLETEEKRRELIVAQNSYFTVLAPFASLFPCELWIVPRDHNSSLSDLSGRELSCLAHLLQQTINSLGVLLERPSLNYYFHLAPSGEYFFHWHLEIIPRISIPAGFEYATGVMINTYAPQEAAEQLRSIINEG